jgi:hypothetical protein
MPRVINAPNELALTIDRNVGFSASRRNALRVLEGGYTGGHKKGHGNSEKGVTVAVTP